MMATLPVPPAPVNATPTPSVPSAPKNGASDSQVDLIKTLIGEIREFNPTLADTYRDGLNALWSKGDLSRDRASKTIGDLIANKKALKAAAAASTPVTAPSPTDVPAGRYAIPARDGHVVFYRVDKPTDGRWAGYTFVNLLVGSPGDWRTERVRDWRGVIDRIRDFGFDASAKLFAEKARCCSFCGSPITHVCSRAAGWGPKCASKWGLPYPSEDEARVALRERGIDPDDQGTWWNE